MILLSAPQKMELYLIMTTKLGERCTRRMGKVQQRQDKSIGFPARCG